jgi:hypothetical protein
MRRFVATFLAALVLGSTMALAGTARAAHAGEWWCWDDPVLVLNGQVLHIYAGVTSNAVRRVTLADMVITVPAGVDAKVTAANAPRFPQTARLVRAGALGADGSVPVSATLIVNGHGRFEAALKIVQPSGAETVTYGESNHPISVSYVLPIKKSPTPTRK